jgi:hypothetical protein
MEPDETTKIMLEASKKALPNPATQLMQEGYV